MLYVFFKSAVRGMDERGAYRVFMMVVFRLCVCSCLCVCLCVFVCIYVCVVFFARLSRLPVYLCDSVVYFSQWHHVVTLAGRLFSPDYFFCLLQQRRIKSC